MKLTTDRRATIVRPSDFSASPRELGNLGGGGMEQPDSRFYFALLQIVLLVIVAVHLHRLYRALAMQHNARE